MEEERTDYIIDDVPIMKEDMEEILLCLSRLETPITGNPKFQNRIKDDFEEQSDYEDYDAWDDAEEDSGGWDEIMDVPDPMDEADIDRKRTPEKRKPVKKSRNSNTYDNTVFFENHKQVSDWSQEEDLAIFNCLHSGDSSLIMRAKEIIAKAIVFYKYSSDGQLKPISPLMEGKRLREIRRVKGDSIAEEAVTYLWLEIEKSIMTWRPFANGHRIHLSYFIRERCTKEALDQLSQATDTKNRKTRQIKEERDIAKAEAFMKEHGITNPSLGDYREILILFAETGKIRLREKNKLTTIKKHIDRRAENGKYEHFLTTEEHAYRNLDNASNPGLDEDITDVVYAERLTEYVTERVNVECLNELHPIHRKYVMAYIKASVNSHIRREQKAAEEQRPRPAQVKNVSMVEVKRVYIEEFGGDPNISDLAFRKMVSTATREYRKARLNRLLIEPQKGSGQYMTGIKFNRNFEESDNELKDDIQYMFESGLWD